VQGSIKIGGGFPSDSVELADDRYIFDEVLNQEATQSMVFERTAKPLLPGVLEGYNATIFAYGVSPLLASADRC
jgi:kinesin family protein 18/19